MQITPITEVPSVQPIGRTDTDAASTGSGTAASTATQIQAATTASTLPARLLNPQPVINPALGIVVTEYFNQAGQMTNQYPTEKMIDSYRIYGLHDTG